MTIPTPLRRGTLAALLAFAFVLQATSSVLAGTTGGVNGNVTDENHRPLSGAKVTIASPTQSATTSTDAAGHYAFLALLPDTYTVTVTQPGYAPDSVGGVTVQADNTVNIDLHAQHQLKQIGTVTSRSNTELVRAGVTSDVYSVSAAQATAAQGLGGGGSLNQAYSAVAAVPGAYVPVGQSGWNQQSTCAAPTTTRPATSTTACRSTARSTTTPRTPRPASGSRSCRSTPAAGRPAPRPRAWAGSSTRPCGPGPIPAPRTSPWGWARRPSTTSCAASWAGPAPTAASATTWASTATTRTSATSTSSTAPRSARASARR